MHPESSPDALERRLRTLAPPPVPAGLEARLLAGIPASKPKAPRQWPVWVGLAVAVATACLLAIFARPRPDRPVPSPNPPQPEAVREASPQRYPDGTSLPPFSWPLEETSPLRVSTALPADLFD